MIKLIETLNILSPVFGLLGSIIIFIYGVPKVIDDGGKDYWHTGEVDPEKLQQIKKYKCWGNTGLILVGLSFLAQLLIIAIPNV